MPSQRFERRAVTAEAVGRASLAVENTDNVVADIAALAGL